MYACTYMYMHICTPCVVHAAHFCDQVHVCRTCLSSSHLVSSAVSMPAEPPLPTVGVGLPTVGAGFSPLSPEGMEAQGHRISLEPHEILQLPRTDDADSCDMPVGLHGNSHDVYQSTHGAVNHTGEPDAASAAGRSEERDAPAASGGASLPSSLPVDPSPLSTHSLAAPTIAVGQPPSATPTLPSSAHSLAAPTIAVGQPPSATPTLPSSAASKVRLSLWLRWRLSPCNRLSVFCPISLRACGSVAASAWTPPGLSPHQLRTLNAPGAGPRGVVGPGRSFLRQVSMEGKPLVREAVCLLVVSTECPCCHSYCATSSSCKEEAWSASEAPPPCLGHHSAPCDGGICTGFTRRRPGECCLCHCWIT